MKYLNESGVKLTELEVKSLECILSQGSFYEEALYGFSTDSIEDIRSCFFGWEIDESEVPGCRGALASLVKKGVINVVDDEECSAYYTNYAFKFNENRNKRYHTLDLTGIEVI